MEIRDLDPGDLDRAFDIRTRSFGVTSDSGREAWYRRMRRAIAGQRVLGCYHHTELVATARINDFRQWWQGHSLPMAGVGGVVVAPEHRGRGVGRRLMLGVLERAATLGYPLSTLFPATVPLYRRCGWEIAGSRYLVTIPAEALRSLATAPVPVRRVGPDDAAAIVSVVRVFHTSARTSGPVDWEEEGVRDWLTDDRPFAYLAEDGFLAYHWEGEDLEVDEVVAGSGDTARTLWSLVGSGSSIAKTVKASIGPDDPIRWLTTEEVIRPDGEQRWMLRLVDLPAALGGRGYPAGIDAEVTLGVEDPHLPSNTGTWRLTVADGAGKVERTQSPAAVHLDPRGLAALYAGTPLLTLRSAGLVRDGDPGTDALLDALFAARPYLLDYF